MSALQKESPCFSWGRMSSNEVRRRDFNCNQILSEELLKDMPAHLINTFTPSEEEIKISRARIEDRLKNGKPKSYKLME